MLTDSPPEEGALLMPCTDLDSHFSFNSCPHSSHGFVCTTTDQPNENQDAGNPCVYPSPPPTTSQPKQNVPLPSAARYHQHQFGGILDSPLVLMKAPAHSPLSPPPTIPTLTHALPPSDAQDSQVPSLLLPIEELHDESQSSPRPRTPQLLSPISPEWLPTRKPEEEEDVYTVDDSRHDCVLMSQPVGAYDYSFDSDADDDILGNAGTFRRPALLPLDIPMYQHKDEMILDDHDNNSGVGAPEGVLLGFPGTMAHPHRIVGGHDSDADSMSPFDYAPPSPSSSRDFDSPSPMSESDLEDDLGFGPSSYLPSPLRSFACLSPELDDLDLDMALGPGLGLAPSPSRRSVASLPDLDDEYDAQSSHHCHSDSWASFLTSPLDSSSSSAVADATTDDSDVPMSPPPSDSVPTPVSSSSLSDADAKPTHPPANSLGLDLPPISLPFKPPPPSILDPFTPAELAARLPASFPEAELDALLAVRGRAREALAACAAAPGQSPSTMDVSSDSPNNNDNSDPNSNSSSSGNVVAAGSGTAAPSGVLDHELRRNVPRDAGEPRRRRKRAKELGREVDALVGLVLGILPPAAGSAANTCTTTTASSSASASTLTPPDCADEQSMHLIPPLPEPPAKDKGTGGMRLRREKAGLAGLESVQQLVARMILRRRERCVRGLDGGVGRKGMRRPSSPLAVPRSLNLEEGDEGWGDEGGEEEDAEPPTPLSPVADAMELDG
ncbi:hypothetical protein R3P38DRAFT_2910312 [Favolaschia claudopus]|uniref:Uncharacterized protein n=1 Tax=Favolaschia claudopus TaxID=2862362 RepID=A0AAW0CCY2_9AGAR